MSGGAGLMGMNGKTGEVLRWAFGMVMAAVVAYFTGQIATERRFAAIESRVESRAAVEQQHFEEIQRALTRIEGQLIRLEERRR